jgi:hypothetical protein
LRYGYRTSIPYRKPQIITVQSSNIFSRSIVENTIVGKDEDKAVPKLQLTLALIAMLLLPGSSFAAVPMLEGEVVLARVKIGECLADVKEVTSWDEAQT